MAKKIRGTPYHGALTQSTTPAALLKVEMLSLPEFPIQGKKTTLRLENILRADKGKGTITKSGRESDNVCKMCKYCNHTDACS
jgi:hypothetical protein